MMLSGCSPQVYTNIQKSYPARAADANVIVFDLDQIPTVEAETLGEVRVYDGGTATNCKYEQVVAIAKKEVNKVGGNGLMITEHQKPSFWGSSCHQIAGMMIYMPDSLTNSAGIKQYYRLPAAAEVSKPRRTDANTIYINAGYGFIVSKVENAYGTAGNSKQGFALSTGYQWVSRSGFGAGLRYAGYFTHLTDYYDDQRINIGLHYVGPEFVGRAGSDNGKWYLCSAFGMGYARYTESKKNISFGTGGFGISITGSVDYRVSKVVGIGAALAFYSAMFDSKELSGDYKNSMVRINHMSISGGLRFYF